MNRRHYRRQMARRRRTARRGAYAVHTEHGGQDKLEGVNAEGILSYALFCPNRELREAALDKIDNDWQMGTVAVESVSDDTRRSAIRRITDREVLREVILFTKDDKIRERALKKIIEM